MPDVSAADVALVAGLPLPLTEQQQATVEAAIVSAYRQATAYLGRPARPTQITQRGVYPHGGRLALSASPVIALQQTTPELDAHGHPTGAYTVVYTAGLDPENDPVYGAALTEFVIAAAAAAPQVRRLAQQTPGARLISAVNVEGQGVTYEQAPAGASVPGVESLAAWQDLAPYTRAGIEPHPLDTGRMWWH